MRTDRPSTTRRFLGVAVAAWTFAACSTSPTVDIAGTPTVEAEVQIEQPAADDASSAIVGGAARSVAPIVIAPSDPGAATSYVSGERVAFRQPALIGPVVVTVGEIVPGEALETGTPTIAVAVTFANTVDASVAGPDVYVVCGDDGRLGFPVPESEIQSLTTLASGEAVAGTVTIEAVADCAEPLLQVRVLPRDGGNDPIAEYEIPPEMTQ